MNPKDADVEAIRHVTWMARALARAVCHKFRHKPRARACGSLGGQPIPTSLGGLRAFHATVQHWMRQSAGERVERVRNRLVLNFKRLTDPNPSTFIGWPLNIGRKVNWSSMLCTTGKPGSASWWPSLSMTSRRGFCPCSNAGEHGRWVGFWICHVKREG